MHFFACFYVLCLLINSFYYTCFQKKRRDINLFIHSVNSAEIHCIAGMSVVAGDESPNVCLQELTVKLEDFLTKRGESKYLMHI